MHQMQKNVKDKTREFEFFFKKKLPTARADGSRRNFGGQPRRNCTFFS